MPPRKGSKFNSQTGHYEVPGQAVSKSAPVESEPETVRPIPEQTSETPKPEADTPAFDEDIEFITPKDVKALADKPVPRPAGPGAPMERGFIADMVAGAGQKLHDTEYALTGHPVFQHTEADERIWLALGKYVENTIDPAKYGLVILITVLLLSEGGKVAVFASDRVKEKQHHAPAGKTREVPAGATGELPPLPPPEYAKGKEL
jgi:hypothetical protein